MRPSTPRVFRSLSRMSRTPVNKITTSSNIQPTVNSQAKNTKTIMGLVMPNFQSYSRPATAPVPTFATQHYFSTSFAAINDTKNIDTCNQPDVIEPEDDTFYFSPSFTSQFSKLKINTINQELKITRPPVINNLLRKSKHSTTSSRIEDNNFLSSQLNSQLDKNTSTAGVVIISPQGKDTSLIKSNSPVVTIKKSSTNTNKKSTLLTTKNTVVTNGKISPSKSNCKTDNHSGKNVSSCLNTPQSVDVVKAKQPVHWPTTLPVSSHRQKKRTMAHPKGFSKMEPNPPMPSKQLVKKRLEPPLPSFSETLDNTLTSEKSVQSRTTFPVSSYRQKKCAMFHPKGFTKMEPNPPMPSKRLMKSRREPPIPSFSETVCIVRTPEESVETSQSRRAKNDKLRHLQPANLNTHF